MLLHNTGGVKSAFFLQGQVHLCVCNTAPWWESGPFNLAVNSDIWERSCPHKLHPASLLWGVSLKNPASPELCSLNCAAGQREAGGSASPAGLTTAAGRQRPPQPWGWAPGWAAASSSPPPPAADGPPAVPAAKAEVCALKSTAHITGALLEAKNDSAHCSEILLKLAYWNWSHQSLKVLTLQSLLHWIWQ